MKKLSKEEIKNIGISILEESDIVANHGTSIQNGLSILETGFNFNRTSMIFHNSEDVINLCTYGWKENEVGSAANIIISIPKEFYKQLFNYDDISYGLWIDNIRRNQLQLELINSVSNFDFKVDSIFKATVPKEFIRGMFVYTDGKNYLSFFENKEAAMNYLTYIDNPYFFMNLQDEEKFKFVSIMKEKIFPSSQSKTFK